MFESFKIENLSFKYSCNSPILQNIFLSAKESEIIEILGRNGTGKSTLFNALTISSDFTGSTFLNDIYIPQKKLIKQISYLPQNSFLPKETTVKSAVKMFPLSKDKKNEILQDNRISSISNQKIASLSGGEKRYLEFLVINNCPKPIKFLDEPFSEVEPIFEQKICEQITSNKKGNLYIITDHKLSVMKDLCTRFYLLINGSLIEITDKNEIVKYGYAYDI
ncbi:MAG: ATP-binding cassette domain-containing protein [Treponema sp.]|nr:ATP-binding cassette domain-containing protein [Treponema sp.]